ncbi:MAG: DUF2290 domain-containing protein [Clostridia bacterium]|nr:DUF2290 domain-containing protein [Clostridia bacterium]
MDAYKLIKEDIQSFVRTWLKTGLISNPQIGGDFFSDLISIKSKLSLIKDEEEYIKNFVDNYEKGMYLLTIDDGSFFQAAYEFNRMKNAVYLVKASISYFPCVNAGKLIHPYIRLDYDSKIQNSFFHAITHLHIGFDNGIRIPTDEIPLFSEFFKFIMYLYYHDKFLKIVNKKAITDTHTKDRGRLTQYIPISKELGDFVHLKLSNIQNI